MHKPSNLRLLHTPLLILAIILCAPPLKAQSLLNKPRVIKWVGDGITLELAALSGDQVRAFFLGRGFTPKNADYIAHTGCIFRTVMGSSASGLDFRSITIELEKWQIINKKGHTTPRTREGWAKIWDEKKVPQSAKIAFHWSLFPTSQTYQPSDYGFGMISFARPAGSRFDLTIHWLQNTAAKTRTFKNMECAR